MARLPTRSEGVWLTPQQVFAVSSRMRRTFVEIGTRKGDFELRADKRIQAQCAMDMPSSNPI